MIKCKHCKKGKGEHLAKTLHCPIGSKYKIGYIMYHPTQVFEPGKDDGKKEKEIVFKI